MNPISTRQPHATMDVPSRNAKGLKIERLLRLLEKKQPIRLLDIGTGSGGIAHYFGTHCAIRCVVTSVDVTDQRKIVEGYTFIQLKDKTLPFADGSFDVVISNHVIEHVGESADQGAHLRELRRVLATDGVGYLAVPSRWMIVEPHYRLAFLSWLPRALRSPYLRLTNKGLFYDCEPLTVFELEYLLNGAGFRYSHLHVESIRETFAIEEGQHSMRWIAALPNTILMLLRRLTPTLIYRLEK